VKALKEKWYVERYKHQSDANWLNEAVLVVHRPGA